MKQHELADLFFKALLKVHETEQAKQAKLVAVEQLFTQLIFALTQSVNLRFTTMFARTAFACHEHQISKTLQWHIHRLRKQQSQYHQVSEEQATKLYQRSLKTVAFAIAAFCQVPVPDPLKELLPQEEEQIPTQDLRSQTKLDRLRVQIVGALEDKELLMANPIDAPSELIYIKYNVTAHNEHFTSSIRDLKRHFNYQATVNLVDVSIDDGGIYRFKQLVLEPDYLVDVSNISECFQNFGTSPLLYLLKKFLPFDYSIPLMLGNIANYFLDELMNHPEATFVDTFPKVFVLNPLAFATFEDKDIRTIYQRSQKHFTNLKTTVKQYLKENHIQPEDCYLEPSFFSEKYGIQGRLDIWHQPVSKEGTAIVELKSGKPFAPNRYGISQNHYTQTILYDLLVRSVFDAEVDPKMYILYSGSDQDHLRYAPPLKMQQDEAIKLRNQIIGIEQYLANLDAINLEEQLTLLDRLSPDLLPKASPFVQRDLALIAKTLQAISPLERLYFLYFVSFTAREQQLAKTGLAGKENVNGLAALWLTELEEKQQNFEVLGFLKVTNNQTSQDPPIISFERTEQTNPLANFRQGDIVVIYPYFQETDNALTNQIFKGSITAINQDAVSVKLHCRQFNDQFFKTEGFWHIEHDMLESGFRVQYRALFGFLQASKKERALLLTTKAPEQAPSKVVPLSNPQLSEEQKKVLYKAIAAKDYFLLVGPPGTGKTKFMLAEMVQYLLKNTQEQILLLAYTNRAVDEICHAITEFAEKDYLRMGSPYSSAPEYQHRLFSEQTKQLKKRHDLRAVLNKHRIMVATVASIANRSSLFKIKQFDTVIIDEASQILEPMLVGLLPKFKRFILIGDHKQLPAVVLQDQEQSAVDVPTLNAIGLKNRRNSLFERLYQRAEEQAWDWAYDRLSHQGRMHDDICRFPSQFFYDNQLLLLPSPMNEWQLAPLNYPLPPDSTPLMELLSQHRLLYFNAATNDNNYAKTNAHEADLVGELITAFDQLYQQKGETFDPANKVGVITPFRAQIAQIQHTLSQAKKGYEQCTIDTVERYQGGAREIIIISLCVNNSLQLESVRSLSDDKVVDRKLNVALTRARQHLILIGNKTILQEDARYAQLIDWIEAQQLA